jgi:predicted HAD superfamily Cof-like phosphohydrolase
MAGRRGRPESEKPRELTKRQRWTAEEWVEVEKASSAAEETPSDFVRAATLQRCRKKTR